MVKLTYKGKVVFTSRMMQELCHITDAILSRYSTKPDNPLLQENEDYIIINLEEFNEFAEENSDKNNYLEKRHKSKLFYESALDKIKKDRKRLEERPRRERISNIAELEIKELKHQIDSLKKENEELKKKLNNLGIL